MNEITDPRFPLLARIDKLRREGKNAFLHDLTADQIHALAKELIDRGKEVSDAVAARAANNPTLDGVLRVTANFEALYAVARSSVDFPQSVSTDKVVRDASTEAEELLSAFEAEDEARRDVFLAWEALAKTEEARALDPSDEDARFLQRVLRDYRRKGMYLEDEGARARLVEIDKRASEIGIRFARNLNEDQTSELFAEEQLDGMSKEWLDGHRVSGEGDRDGDEASSSPPRFKVTLDYPDLFPVLEECKVEATRKRMAFLRGQQCREQNVPLMDELLALRVERAAILGFPTHADFVLETRMAKSPSAVRSFLEDLEAKSLDARRAERLAMIEALGPEGQEAPALGDGLAVWNRFRGCRLIEERKYQIDHDAIREYFPVSTVVERVLALYERMLGLRFVRVASGGEDDGSPARFWHEDVKHFAVLDADGSPKEERIGEFFVDLHPREGKYGHAACFTLQPAAEILGGEPGAPRQIPVAALVCNFDRALLRHSEFETFFHELGHVLHAILGRCRHARFSGTHVERDFVEAPSQMLENWCWDAQTLRQISGHKDDPSRPLPEDTIAKLVASREANVADHLVGQLALATFDQTLHNMRTGAGPPPTTEEVWQQASAQFGMPAMPETNMASSFGHMAGGYDAQYYGYLWSEVFAADMFETVFARAPNGGALDPEAGRRYRKHILEPGGSRDAHDLLRAFLGREPSAEAFFRLKGIANTNHNPPPQAAVPATLSWDGCDLPSETLSRCNEMLDELASTIRTTFGDAPSAEWMHVDDVKEMAQRPISWEEALRSIFCRFPPNLWPNGVKKGDVVRYYPHAKGQVLHTIVGLWVAIREMLRSFELLSQPDPASGTTFKEGMFRSLFDQFEKDQPLDHLNGFLIRCEEAMISSTVPQIEPPACARCGAHTGDDGALVFVCTKCAVVWCGSHPCACERIDRWLGRRFANSNAVFRAIGDGLSQPSTPKPLS